MFGIPKEKLKILKSLNDPNWKNIGMGRMI